jgi:hypothetical protein
MSTPQFLITKYLESNELKLDELKLNSNELKSEGLKLGSLRKRLFERGIYSKEYVNDNLLLIYHKYDMTIKNEEDRECRSLVLCTKTNKILSYSGEVPRLNKDGMEYLIAHSNNPTIINKCYEGTLLSIYYNNDKWYVSTRRCLDSKESKFNSDISHFHLFEDVLSKTEYKTFEKFSERLNKENSYYFVLIHHLNKHVINYENEFGKDYTKLCLSSIRDKDMRELDLYNNLISIADNDNIFISKKLDSLVEFTNNNKMLSYDTPVLEEGIIVKSWDSNTNKYRLIKLQNINYQFAQVIGPEKDILKGLVHLYQNNRLIEYFKQGDKSLNNRMRTITNPYNTSKSYDTVGIIDSVFKVCTSELFELYKSLWSLKDGKHMNKDLYNLLPKEYKDLLFEIRGIYYKKKASFYNVNMEMINFSDIKNSHLKINDIYDNLKAIPTERVLSFLRMRRLMLNWVIALPDNKNLIEFGKISHKCDKIQLKLCSIFTNKLFPDIMTEDLPPSKESDVLMSN